MNSDISESREAGRDVMWSPRNRWHLKKLVDGHRGPCVRGSGLEKAYVRRQYRDDKANKIRMWIRESTTFTQRMCIGTLNWFLISHSFSFQNPAGICLAWGNINNIDKQATPKTRGVHAELYPPELVNLSSLFRPRTPPEQQQERGGNTR